jgi:hypothetical protein
MRTLDGGVLTHAFATSPSKNIPTDHCRAGWLDPRPGLDEYADEKISCPHRSARGESLYRLRLVILTFCQCKKHAVLIKKSLETVSRKARALYSCRCLTPSRFPKQVTLLAGGNGDYCAAVEWLAQHGVLSDCARLHFFVTYTEAYNN